MEDDGWQYAMNLLLEMESASMHFVSSALLSQLDSSTGILEASSEVKNRERSGSSLMPSAGEFDYHQNLLIMSIPQHFSSLSQNDVSDVYYLSSLHQQALVNTTHRVLSRLARWSVRFFEQVEPVGISVIQTIIYVPKMVVSKSPVSIHLPLHRLLAKCILAAVQAGQSNMSVGQGISGNSGALCVRECLCSLHRLLFLHCVTSQQPFCYDPSTFHTVSPLIAESCSKFSDENNTLLLLMEAPLMALVFAAQVRQGLWRRNGASVANLAYNYAVPVLSKYYRELDMTFLQLIVSMGIMAELDSRRLRLFDLEFQSARHTFGLLTSESFRRFLTLATHRFELSGVVEAFRRVSLLPSDHPQNKQLQELDETVFLFFSEYLKFICQYFTEIPSSYTKSPYNETENVTPENWNSFSDADKIRLYMRHHGLMAAVMRETVHQVLGGNTSVTQMAKVKGLIGFPQRTVSDKLLTEAVSLVCTVVGDSSDGSQTLAVKDAAYQLYDPEYSNLSASQATTAFDRVKDRFKQVKKAYTASGNASTSYFMPRKAPMNPYMPVIFPLAIPEVHTTMNMTQDSIPDNVFHVLRSQLFTPYFGEMLYRWMCVAQKAKTNQVTLVGRIVQLLTLQIHCRPNIRSANTVPNDAALLGIGELSKDWIAHYDGISMYHIPLLRLLVPFFTDKTQLAESEPFYHEGLGFVLYEIAFHNETIRMELQSLGFTVEYFEQLKKQKADDSNRANVIPTEDDKAKTVKKKKTIQGDSGTTKLTAQQRALEKMKNAASLFATSNTAKKTKKLATSANAKSDISEGDVGDGNNNPFAGIDDDSDDEKEETDLCILCKEKKENSPKGYLCFVQSSAASKQFLLHDACNNQDELRNTFVVVSLNGCDVIDDFQLYADIEKNNRATVVRHLEHGEHVVAFRTTAGKPSPGGNIDACFDGNYFAGTYLLFVCVVVKFQNLPISMMRKAAVVEIAGCTLPNQ